METMRRFFSYCLSLCILLLVFPMHVVQGEEIQLIHIGRDQLFSNDWLFLEEDVQDGSLIEFNDSNWKRVDLPHDYMIHHDFTLQAEAESGFLLGGIGWYRKHFTVDESLKEKQFILRFEGIYMNADIYLNGNHLGFHPNGYTSFSVDLTEDLLFKEENVLAIRVDATTPNSRWYSGAGIYRDVYLSVLEPTHFEKEETLIVSTNKEDSFSTKVHLQLSNSNPKQSFTIQGKLYNQNRELLHKEEKEITLSENQKEEIELLYELNQVELWDVKNPYLYTYEFSILKGNQVVDKFEMDYGYRTFFFDPEKGFFLNDEPMKLKGVCLHHDQGSLGSALYETSLKRQLEKMKEMGVNAIRVTHNPSSLMLRKLCDEMGFLMIDEAFDTWALAKNHNYRDGSSYFLETIPEESKILNMEEGMSYREYDIKTMVRDGRNHPCIIMWSIGNEILGNIGGDTSMYPTYAEELVQWVKEMDSTRPVTIGDNLSFKSNPIQLQMNEPIIKEGGVIGFNYASGDQYDLMHEEYPEWPLYGSEVSSSYASRGYYGSYGINQETNEIGSYWYEAVDWGSTMDEAWESTISRDYVAGEFIWTGFDYIGEPEPWNGLQPGRASSTTYTPRSSYFGVVDTAGFEKDAYYYYQSQWNEDVHTLHLLPIWNDEVVKDENGNIRVHVYSDLEEVELFLNGVSQGKKNFGELHKTEVGYTYHDTQYLTWSIPYEEGIVSAKGYDANGKEVIDTKGRKEISSFLKPSDFIVSYHPYHSVDKRNLSYFEMNIIDKEGKPVENANSLFQVQVEGSTLLGLDNGDQRDFTNFQKEERNAYNGKLVGIVQGKDTIGKTTIKITSMNQTKEINLYTVPDLTKNYKKISPFQ